MGERTIEEVNGGDNSKDTENTNLDRRAIHIHGRMEHNLVGYTNYYFYKSTKIWGGSGFIRKIDYRKRNFLGHSQVDAIKKVCFNFGTFV